MKEKNSKKIYFTYIIIHFFLKPGKFLDCDYMFKMHMLCLTAKLMKYFIIKSKKQSKHCKIRLF